MDDQKKVVNKGGTMRLGAYECVLTKGSHSAEAYGSDSIFERHRHRFEFNNDYRELIEKAGMSYTGISPDGTLVEMIERPDHPWFVTCQFHPEFKSRPLQAHPLFDAFMAAAVERRARHK
jgi:CTP synthase